jgi:hypothetical protein
MKRLLVSALVLGCAAGIGYSFRRPNDFLHIGLFEAVISCLLAVLVWGVFHLLGLDQLPRPRARAAGAISVLAWALLLATCVAVVRQLERPMDREHQHLLELRT